VSSNLVFRRLRACSRSKECRTCARKRAAYSEDRYSSLGKRQRVMEHVFRDIPASFTQGVLTTTGSLDAELLALAAAADDDAEEDAAL
jgi:hypothetical protein